MLLPFCSSNEVPVPLDTCHTKLQTHVSSANVTSHKSVVTHYSTTTEETHFQFCYIFSSSDF